MSISQTEFDKLKEEWERDTGFLSSSSKIHSHWAYQEIIAAGKPALPYILHELQEELDHWFYALTQISGKDVAKGEATMDGARQEWLAWGRKEGYI